LFVAAVVVEATDNRVALYGFHLGHLAPRDGAALRWQLIGADNAGSSAGDGFGENPTFADPLAAGSIGARPRRTRILLFTGGSGIVPLMAMLRQRILTGSAEFRLVYSVHSPGDYVFAAPQIRSRRPLTRVNCTAG
jgi:hypothetical protein